MYYGSNSNCRKCLYRQVMDLAELVLEIAVEFQQTRPKSLEAPPAIKQINIIFCYINTPTLLPKGMKSSFFVKYFKIKSTNSPQI